MHFSEIFDLKSCWKLLPKTKIRQLRSGNYKFAACLPPPVVFDISFQRLD